MEYNNYKLDNAPQIPFGKSIGKESMTFALSNRILNALPIDKLSSGARQLYEFLSIYAAEEIRKAVLSNSYDFSDTSSKRFSFNLKEYKKFCEDVGKKHYTYEEIDACAGELVNIPIKFMENDGTIKINTVVFSSIIIDVVTGECNYEMTYTFLTQAAPELAELKEIHLLSLTESFKFSSSYQNALYRLLNGVIQETSFVSEYSVPIAILKARMGVKEGSRAWNINDVFMERIFSKTCNEINLISDISFQYRKEYHEKSRRIKNIVFFDMKRIKRKTLSDSHTIDYIDVDYKETNSFSNEHKLIETNVVPVLSEDEKVMARIIGYSRNHGFTGDESFELYDLYKNDIELFISKTQLYDEMVRRNIINQESKMEFFRLQ